MSLNDTLAPSRIHVYVRDGVMSLTSGVHADDIPYIRADIAEEMLAALETLLAGLEGALPPGLYPEGSWLDILPQLDEPVADARDAIAKAKAKGESE